MQESLEAALPNKQEEDEKDQPAEMEYLNSRCVLFTYFQGDIGSVVDEHFSRALNQASSVNPEPVISKSKMGLNPLWRGKIIGNGLIKTFLTLYNQLSAVWIEFYFSNRVYSQGFFKKRFAQDLYILYLEDTDIDIYK